MYTIPTQECFCVIRFACINYIMSKQGSSVVADCALPGACANIEVVS